MSIECDMSIFPRSSGAQCGYYTIIPGGTILLSITPRFSPYNWFLAAVTWWVMFVPVLHYDFNI